jgi:hypothetical protein
LPPATMENGAGRRRCGVVCGCPLGTGRNRCEWHGSSTPDEDDARRARKSRHQLDRRVRPDPGDHRLVGKGRRRPAAAGRWDRRRLHADRATEVRSGKVLGSATRAAAASRKSSVRPPCPCSRSPRRRCTATASDSLAAGFDSYLSRQVNVVKLVHTVRQQCPDVGRVGRCLLDLLWHWRTLELSRAFPLARRPAVTVSLCLPAGSSSRPCS